MSRRERPYLFYGATRALCGTCLVTCDAKELIEDGKVYLWKRCLEHGVERVLLSDDADYFRLCREVFLKPPEQVEKYNTQAEYGCPYDCGICPDHEQHGCVSILEITDHCNLRCPTCFASSGPERLTHRSMDNIRAMLDRIVANEGTADVVQVSGGEPTLHPEFFDVLDECRKRPIRHLMVNTNGIRIAKDRAFAEQLARYAPGFELYLQFDGFNDNETRKIRGADLLKTKKEALQTLNELNLSTTLVVTVQRGVNDLELGEILRFAQTQRCVRGVTFQPLHDSGRNDGFRVEGRGSQEDRLTLSEVRRKISQQFELLTPADIVPVPCHPDAVAMAYAVRGEGENFAKLEPLTRYIPADVLINAGKNTIIYEGDKLMIEAAVQSVFRAFSTGHGPEGAGVALKELMCCLPQVTAQPNLTYDRVFRVIIMQFLDRHIIDLRSIRKSCVHIAHPDGKRMIPFDAFNLFYRDDLEKTVLDPIRARTRPEGSRAGGANRSTRPLPIV